MGYLSKNQMTKKITDTRGERITSKQKRLLEIIYQRSLKGLSSPTYEEMSEKTGVTTRAIHQSVSCLLANGFLHKNGERLSRALALTEKGFGVVYKPIKLPRSSCTSGGTSPYFIQTDKVIFAQ